MPKRPASRPPDLEGYEYVRLLGSGGFSDVFLYRQRLPAREVAVKVLLAPPGDEQVLHRFVTEANVMAQLSAHPAIVTIHQADTAPDGRPFIVMEYCPRPSLGQRFRTERFGVAEAMRLAVRLAGAVETAHRAGILHRDMKPANVLTTDYGWPALTDFGIAVAIDDPGMDERGGMSIPWAPPESFGEGDPRDATADVYSLAATIYSVLAGRAPFEKVGGPNTALDMIRRIERDPLPPLGRADVPAELEAVLTRAMAKAPAQRYATAAEFARAIQAVEADLHLTPTTFDVPEAAQIRSAVDLAEEGTRLRGVVAPAKPAGSARPLATPVARPEPGLAPTPEPGDEPAPASRRRRAPLVVAGVVLVGAVIAIGASALLDDPPPDQGGGIQTLPPNDQRTLALPPAPSDLVLTRQGDAVTATWQPADQDGLEYVLAWTGADGRDQSLRTAATTATIPDLPSGTCVTVQSVTQSRSLSSEAESPRECGV